MKKDLRQSTTSAIFLVFTSNVLSKIMGFLLVLVLAAKVGTSGEGDAYAFAFILPDLVNHLLAGSAMSIAFIPVFQELAANSERQNRFFSNIFTVGTLIFVLFISVCFIFAPHFIKILAGNSITSDQNVYLLTVKLTRIVLPAQLFFFWGSVFIGIQQANRNYRFSSLAPIIYDTAIILFGFFLYKRLGISAFSWGVLIGAFSGHALLQFLGAKRFRVSYSPVIDLSDFDFKQWFYKTVPLMLGLGITFSNEFTFRFFGSRVDSGQGSIAALNYAYKIVMIIVALFASSVAAPIYPFLCEQASKKNYAEMEKILVPIFAKTAAAVIVVSALIYPVSKDVISLLFLRKAFDAHSAALTASALTGYLPGVFFLSCVIILQRLFYAVKDTLTPLVISTVSLLLSVPFYKILGNLWGISGISAAASVFSALATVMIAARWYKFYPESALAGVLKPIFISLLTAFLAVIIEIYTSKFIESFGFARILRLCVVIFPALLFSIISLNAFGVIKISQITAVIMRKFSKKR